MDNGQWTIKKKKIINSSKGQVVLTLILVMTVALAIGLSVVQRSLSDISTASKAEQSSRAFSAAEAGIEKAIQSDSGITSPIILDNNATISDVQKNTVPESRQALEYPPIAKEELAQVWLANQQTLSQFYNQENIDVYWGLPTTTSDKPALEVTVVTFSGGIYQSKKFFYDSDGTRTSSNGFQSASCSNPPAIITSLGSNRTFFCKTTLTGLTPTLILLRARILYSSVSQPFAVQPLGGSCGSDACSLPPQARLFTATGISGATQRKVQVFRLDDVVPFFFDYGLFSAGDINK